MLDEIHGLFEEKGNLKIYVRCDTSKLKFFLFNEDLKYVNMTFIIEVQK